VKIDFVVLDPLSLFSSLSLSSLSQLLPSEHRYCVYEKYVCDVCLFIIYTYIRKKSSHEYSHKEHAYMNRTLAFVEKREERERERERETKIVRRFSACIITHTYTQKACQSVRFFSVSAYIYIFTHQPHQQQQQLDQYDKQIRTTIGDST